MALISVLRLMPARKPHLFVTELGTLNVAFPHWYTFEQKMEFVRLLVDNGTVRKQ